MITQPGTLDIWLNAFIPYHVPDYTRLITRGETAGRSAVPLPGVARLNPLNWGHDWDSGFLTDQRGFSNDRGASVRMQSAVSVAVSAAGLVPSFAPMRTSGTVGVKLETGEIVGTSDANMKKCVFRTEDRARPSFNRPIAITPDTATLVLRVKAAASDPLVSASADIDYEGHFRIVRVGRTGQVSVDFAGLVDEFPAFECYASWNGVTKTVFVMAPPAGNTVVDLLGGANRPVTGSAVWG